MFFFYLQRMYTKHQANVKIITILSGAQDDYSSDKATQSQSRESIIENRLQYIVVTVT